MLLLLSMRFSRCSLQMYLLSVTEVFYLNKALALFNTGTSCLHNPLFSNVLTRHLIYSNGHPNILRHLYVTS